MQSPNRFGLLSAAVDGAQQVFAVAAAQAEAVALVKQARSYCSFRKCTADKKSQIGLITCTSAAEPHLTFVVDADKYKGATKGPVDVSKIATRKIVEIVR